MKRFKRFLKFGCFGFLVLVVLLVIALRMLMPAEVVQMSKSADLFAAENPNNFKTIDGVHAAFSGDENAAVTIFIVHGSPGNWGAAAPYLQDSELTSRAFVVAFDRPGYGQSNPGVTVGSFDKQCEQLAAWAETRPGKKIWLGHSFGAPIISKMAVNRPDLVDGLVLSASAMDPDREQPLWFHRLGDTASGRALLNSEWRVTNEECIAFADELKLLAPQLSEIMCPVILMHAKDDSLSSFEHVAWTAEKLSSTKPRIIEFETGDHFILWNRVEETKNALFDLIRE